MNLNEPFEKIRPHVPRGERLYWAGQPKQGMYLTSGDKFLIPFSLFWGGFAFFWEAMVIMMDAGWFFALWGVPFVVIGLYMMIGRFFHDAWHRRNTWYGLSYESAIIVQNNKATVVPLEHIVHMEVNHHPDGRGDIVFGRPTQQRQFNNWPVTTKGNVTPVFERIERADEVMRKIRRNLPVEDELG